MGLIAMWEYPKPIKQTFTDRTYFSYSNTVTCTGANLTLALFPGKTLFIKRIVIQTSTVGGNNQDIAFSDSTGIRLRAFDFDLATAERVIELKETESRFQDALYFVSNPTNPQQWWIEIEGTLDY